MLLLLVLPETSVEILPGYSRISVYTFLCKNACLSTRRLHTTVGDQHGHSALWITPRLTANFLGVGSAAQVSYTHVSGDGWCCTRAAIWRQPAPVYTGVTTAQPFEFKWNIVLNPVFSNPAKFRLVRCYGSVTFPSKFGEHHFVKQLSYYQTSVPLPT